MITLDLIKKLTEVKIAESENFIVDIILKPGNKIIILLDSDNKISIGDCVEMSRYIESNLDREIDDFELSVMSAGLTEPFKITRQYKKNIGKQVNVLTKEGKKLSGRLISVSNEGIELEIKNKEKLEKNNKMQFSIENINFNQIKETKRIISF